MVRASSRDAMSLPCEPACAIRIFVVVVHVVVRRGGAPAPRFRASPLARFLSYVVRGRRRKPSARREERGERREERGERREERGASPLRTRQPASESREILSPVSLTCFLGNDPNGLGTSPGNSYFRTPQTPKKGAPVLFSSFGGSLGCFLGPSPTSSHQCT